MSRRKGTSRTSPPRWSVESGTVPPIPTEALHAMRAEAIRDLEASRTIAARFVAIAQTRVDHLTRILMDRARRRKRRP